MIEEIKSHVSDFTIAGMSQQGKGTPIISLHGWLDNANSFLPLMKKFSSLPITSFDLPGHGDSDYISNQLPTYSINFALWKFIEVIEKRYDGPVILMSHSLGAGISVLLAAIRPDLVQKLVLFDNFTPLPEAEEEIVTRMRSIFRTRKEKRRYYSSYEEAVKARTLNNVSLEIAKVLADRAVKKSEKGHYWSYDYRLQLSSLSKFSLKQVSELIKAVECDVLYFSSKWDYRSFKKNLENILLPLFQSIRKIELDTDNHHFHMDEIHLFEKELMYFLS